MKAWVENIIKIAPANGLVGPDSMLGSSWRFLQY